MEFNTGVALGIIFPATPISSLYFGEDPEVVAGQSVGSALVTWLTIHVLGGAEFGAVQFSRSLAMQVFVPLLPVAAATGGTRAFVEFHKKYEPTEPTHKPSWWNSIAAAMGGTFGGISYE